MAQNRARDKLSSESRDNLLLATTTGKIGAFFRIRRISGTDVFESGTTIQMLWACLKMKVLITT